MAWEELSWKRIFCIAGAISAAGMMLISGAAWKKQRDIVDFATSPEKRYVITKDCSGTVKAENVDEGMGCVFPKDKFVGTLWIYDCAGIAVIGKEKNAIYHAPRKMKPGEIRRWLEEDFKKEDIKNAYVVQGSKNPFENQRMAYFLRNFFKPTSVGNAYSALGDFGVLDKTRYINYNSVVMNVRPEINELKGGLESLAIISSNLTDLARFGVQTRVIEIEGRKFVCYDGIGSKFAIIGDNFVNLDAGFFKFNKDFSYRYFQDSDK